MISSLSDRSRLNARSISATNWATLGTRADIAGPGNFRKFSKITCPSESLPKRARADSRAPRLVIESIEFENFKSYLGRKKIGPFHGSLSCIIGPNGSGKSNVIDGLLFVFGKRAKKIRLSKLNELIFSGPCEVPPQSARVTVHFHEVVDSADFSLASVVPNSAVTVSRTVTRSNQSSYHLNERPSNWAELQSYFVNKGIDLDHNRFLILQGEVEQIALMKPMSSNEHEEGLLEYLEDLIGSSKYVKDIANTKTELEAHMNDRDTALSRLKVSEKELLALEGPRKEAEKYIKLLAETCVQEALKLQGERHADKQREEEELAKLEEAREHLQMKREAEQAAKAKKRELQEKLHAEKAENEKVKKALADLANHEQKMKDTLDAIKLECEKLISDKATSTTNKDKAKKILDKVSKDVQGLTNDKDQYEAESAEAQQMFDKFNSKYKALCEKANMKEFQDSKSQISSKISKTVVAAKEAEREIKKHEDYIKTVQEEQTTFQAESQTLKADFAKIEAELQEAKAEEQEAVNALATEKERQRELRENSRGFRGRVQHAEAELRQVQAELNRKTAQFEKQTSLVKSEILENCHKGALTGCAVYGSVADFISVDERYQTALAAALGPQAESLVVQSDEDSKRIFEFLRERNRGRVQCIALSHIRNIHAEPDLGGLSTRTAARRLIDLVRVSDSKFMPAVQFALKATLVVDTIAQATEISGSSHREQRRPRIVTLRGELLESSGAMTGGGWTQGQAKAPTIRRDELESLERQRAALSAELQKRQTEASEFPSELQLSDAMRELEQGVRATKVERHKRESNAALAKKRLDNLDVKFPKAPQGRRELEERGAELGRAKTKKTEAETKEAALRAELAEVETKEAAALGPDASKLKAAVDDCKTQAEKVKAVVDKLDREISKAQAKIRAEESRIASLAEEITEFDRQIAEAKAKRVHQYQALEEALASVKVVSEVVEKLEKACAGLSAELHSLDAKTREAGKAVEKAERRVAEHQDAYDHALAKVAALTKDLSKIRTEFAKVPLDLLGEREREEVENLSRESALKIDLPGAVLASLDLTEVTTQFHRLKLQLDGVKPNLNVIEEYRKKFEDHAGKKADFDAANGARDECKHRLEDLENRRLSQFGTGFHEIALKLKELYQMLTLGGDAELEFVDPDSPFTKGISFSVRPPKKSWKQISNLSGGEKTLSSLALVFALHHFRPTPLYFLDEIDAALDSHNVQIIANYLKERARGAQFIVISLRNHMFEIADWIVGVYKTHNQSKSLAIDPRNPGAPVVYH